VLNYAISVTNSTEYRLHTRGDYRHREYTKAVKKKKNKKKKKKKKKG
jgi:hypothetical protein